MTLLLHPPGWLLLDSAASFLPDPLVCPLEALLLALHGVYDPASRHSSWYQEWSLSHACLLLHVLTLLE